jgi:hypothetical protein
MEQMFKEIYEQNIDHSMILDKESVMGCIEKSYELGKKESQEKYNKLKSAFEDLLELWAYYGKYNSSRNHMEEDWRKEAGLL